MTLLRGKDSADVTPVVSRKVRRAGRPVGKVVGGGKTNIFIEGESLASI